VILQVFAHDRHGEILSSCAGNGFHLSHHISATSSGSSRMSLRGGHAVKTLVNPEGRYVKIVWCPKLLRDHGRV